MNYKIEKGDTLSGIAERYNTTVDAIALANGIKNKNLIYAGDTLTIPDSGEVSGGGEISVSGSRADGAVSSGTLTGSASRARDYAKWQERRPSAPQNTYSDDIKGLVSELLGMDFSYDPQKDTAYKLLQDQYRRNARLAMEDSLAALSGRTGGYGNSYAQTAALSAYGNEMGKAAELIPELWEAAYDRFDKDRDALGDSIALLSDLDGAEFNKYTDLLKQYLSEGEQLFDNYSWESEEEFDRFLDYTELMAKLSK